MRQHTFAIRETATFESAPKAPLPVAPINAAQSAQPSIKPPARSAFGRRGMSAPDMSWKPLPATKKSPNAMTKAVSNFWNAGKPSRLRRS